MNLYATNRFAGDGVTTSRSISFVGGYIDRAHVFARMDRDSDNLSTPIPLTPGMWAGPNQLQGLPVIPVGYTLVIWRDTPKAPMVDFVNGARITERNLDLAHLQGTLIAGEAMDRVSLVDITDFSAAVQTVLDQVQIALQAAQDAGDSAAVALTQAQAAGIHAAAAEASKIAAAGSASAASASAGTASTKATEAAGSASAASTSASTASGHASAAAGSASTATGAATAAGNSAASASTSAGTATTKATEASGSATAAATARTGAETARTGAETARADAITAKNAAEAAAAVATSGAAMMACNLRRVSGTNIELRRYRGNTMIIDGVVRLIPEAGVPLALPNVGVLYNVYAYMSGSSIALANSNTATPLWDVAKGYYTANNNAAWTYVGSVYPAGLGSTSWAALRGVYNESILHLAGSVTGATVPMTAGQQRISATVSGILLPGDAITCRVQATLYTTVANGTVDVNVAIGSSVVATARTSSINSATVVIGATQFTTSRLISDAPAWTTFNLFTTPYTGSGNYVLAGVAGDHIGVTIGRGSYQVQ